MFRKSLPILLIFSIFLKFSCAWDQVVPSALSRIFPFVSDESIEKLRTSWNSGNTTVQVLLALDDWVNKEWVTPPNTVNTAKEGHLTKLQYAWDQAIGFVNHREAVRDYLKYLQGATRVIGYLDQEQNQKLKDRFWRCDLECSNMFNCTEPKFLSGIDKELGTHHQNVTRDLTNLASAAHQFPDFQKRLQWELEI